MCKKILTVFMVFCVSVLSVFGVLGSQMLLGVQDASAAVSSEDLLTTIPEIILVGSPAAGLLLDLVGDSLKESTGEPLLADGGSYKIPDMVKVNPSEEVLLEETISPTIEIVPGDTSGTDSSTHIQVQPSSGGSSELLIESDSTEATGGEFDCDQVIKEHTEKGKLGAMQWILCPALNNTAYTANWIDNTVAKWLGVKSDFYDSNSDAAQIWRNVRNVANVVMIVFLMIVIISQLTGRGIDNYGIKKMLPRLIVMAIIVNLSLYICQIAVDLSNILGTGLRDMFGSFGNINGVSGDTNFVTNGIMGLFAVAGGAGGAAVTAGVTAAFTLGLSTAAAVLVAAIVLVLVIIVAVSILFIMLGLRQVILIACLVLSPLAFVAFVLPNTQNLFKKWWELFKTALIMFPLCGAMGGISHMLKAISNQSSESGGVNVGTYIVMLVLPYVGFFLLPMLLKQAIAALGKLGGALSNMGNTVRNGGRAIGQGAMKVAKTPEMQRRLEESKANRIIRRSGDREALQRRIKDAKARANDTNLSRTERKRAEREATRLQRQARLLNDATASKNKMMTEQEMANIGGVVPLSEEVAISRAMSNREAQEFKGYSDQFDAIPTRSAMSRELTDAFAAYDKDRNDSNATRLRAAIAVADKRGMEKELLDSATNIGFSASNLNDTKVLGAFAGAKSSVLLSQFGIQTGKQEAPEGSEMVERTSLGQFMKKQNIIPGLNAMTALDKKGPSVLVGESDDTFKYINDMGIKRNSDGKIMKDANGNVIGENLIDVNKAIVAGVGANDKVAVEVAEMIRRAKSGDITSLSGNNLAGQSKIVLEALVNKVAIDPTLKADFVKATNGIAQSPNLMAGLQDYQRELFDKVRGDSFFQDAANSTSASVVSASTPASVAQPAASASQVSAAQTPAAAPASVPVQPLPIQPAPAPFEVGHSAGPNEINAKVDLGELKSAIGGVASEAGRAANAAEKSSSAISGLGGMTRSAEGGSAIGGSINNDNDIITNEVRNSTVVNNNISGAAAGGVAHEDGIIRVPESMKGEIDVPHKGGDKSGDDKKS